MNQEAYYEAERQELLLHSVLSQYQIIERYKKKYDLEDEEPKSTVLQMIEDSDDQDLLPMELLLDTDYNDDSAEEYLKCIEVGDKDSLALLLIASIARRYVGYKYLNILSYREMIDIGLDGFAAAVDEYDEENDDHFIAFVIWRIHQAIYQEFLENTIINKEELPEELKGCRVPYLRMKDLCRILEAYDQLQKEHEPTYKELVNLVGPSIEIIRNDLKPDPKMTLEQELQTYYENTLHLNAEAPSDEALQALRDMSETEPIDLSALKEVTFNNTELSDYLDEIASIASLSSEEEQNLFEQYKNGDLNAKKKIIRANLILCVRIVKKYFKYRYGIHSDLFKDLILDGNEGLEQAVEAYDETEGTDFKTFAAWYIHRKINEGFALGVRDTNTIEDLYRYICG